MASTVLNYPDAVATRIVDALCAKGGWRSVPLDGARGTFAKQVLGQLLKNVVQDYEMNLAGDPARATAKASVDTDIVIT